MVSNFVKVLQLAKATNSVKASIPNSFEGALQRSFCKETYNIISGFNKSSLCLLDKDRAPKTKIKPSSTLIPVNSSTPKQDENNVEFSITNDTPRLNTIVDNSINSSNFFVNTPPVGPVTPRKALRRAILAAFQSTQSNLTASALQSAKKRRKQVQPEHREVFTYEESLEQLQKEEGERKQKKELKQKQKKKKKMKKAGNNSHDIDEQ